MLPVLLLACLLSGCAAMRSYDREVYGTLDQAAGGNVDAAIRMLEASNRTSKDLLYYLERGMLERLAERYPDSQKSWVAANQRIQTELGIREAMGNAASYVVGDQLRAYEGHDYEKVMLLTYMALNQLALGDWDNARVAIKQTHELEAVIAEQRAKQVAAVEEQARKKGSRTSFKELNGYPVESIDNPAVNALRNSYQSALSHYLAGFVYESLGEGSLSAPGYRLANELQPNQPLLEEALRGLDQRLLAATRTEDDGMSDVLFIIGSGSAPAILSRQFRVPVFVQGRMVFAAMSVPVMAPTAFMPPPTRLTVGDRSLSVTPLTNIDLMARRSLKDEMPSIMLRASVRAATNATAQYQSQRALSDGGERSALIGLAGLVVSTGAALLEHADDRTWRTLPSEISIARARVPRGAHTITLSTPDGQRNARVDVRGRYAVVDLRLLRHRIYVHAPNVSRAQGSEKREALK
ncbi:MAG TPA: hypothetical protein VN675_08610 [Burkholderiales bacterium]|nr:hypothetical protein [Burkholderiales bacterium]